MENRDLKELEVQIKDLNEVLLDCIKISPNLPENIIEIAKSHYFLRSALENREAVREIKKRRLLNKFVQTFDSSEVEEALKIDKKEARRKVKDNDFTTRERNIIMNKFRGCAPGFIKKSRY